jgi:CMP-N-acetylneuraminic acid synthetase
MKIAALVPMRHDSERVRGKNYRPLGGRPLFHHILNALGDCPLVDTIAIDTDSEPIKSGLARSYPEVEVIDRPQELRGGLIPMTDVLRHDVSVVHADLYLQTHSTNPFLRATTITEAIEAFLEHRDRYDSAFSVTPLRARLWSTDAKPLNHDPNVLLRTQDLAPVMAENSCFYLFDAATLTRLGRRIGERPMLIPIEGDEAWEIDEEADWRMAEALHAKRLRRDPARR